MASTVTVSPPNSLVLIAEDLQTADIRFFERGKRIVASPSCIGLGVFTEQDGPTNITLGSPPNTTTRPAFEGILDTPRHYISVWTIEWEKLLEARVSTSRTKVRIWTNHPSFPTEVFVGVGD